MPPPAQPAGTLIIGIFQFLFLWSYANAPKFIVVWFIATALTNTLALLAGYLFWNEHVSLLNAAGIVLILTGVVFIAIK